MVWKNGFIMSVLAAVVLPIFGCSSAYSVKVGLAGDLVANNRVTRQVEVDVFAVYAGQDEYWKKISVDQYFDLDSKMRKETQAKRFRFEAGSSVLQQVFNNSDPVWNDDFFKNKAFLVVLAGLPNPGNSIDGRMKCLPLSSGRWPDNVIDLSVTPTNVDATNGPLP